VSREAAAPQLILYLQGRQGARTRARAAREGPTRHVMSGCVGSPTNGSENGRMAIGRGDASIGPSWAPCEVSAELSIVGAASGGSDVRGRRELIKASSELSKARCAHSFPSDSGGKAYPGCVATQGEVLRAQGRVSGEGATLIWVGVGGRMPSLTAFCSGQLRRRGPGEVRSSGDLGSWCAEWVGGSGFAGCSWGGCRQASATPGG
jgi:hypothetical protein